MTDQERNTYIEQLAQLDNGFVATPDERKSGWLLVCRAMEYLAGRHNMAVERYAGHCDEVLEEWPDEMLTPIADNIYRQVGGVDFSAEADAQVAMFIAETHRMAVSRLNAL